MSKICVIGSFNIDIITTTDRLPKLGETVFSNTFDLFIGGGKGANQVVALGKLGADVRMVGKLGDKFYGPDYLKVLQKNNIQWDTVEVEENAYPGIAVVAVNAQGENILFVYSGANMSVDQAYIDKHWTTISESDFFLLQLEIPKETNLYLMKKLKQLKNKTLILDPAPAISYTEEILRLADIITPNETELEALTGISTSDEAGIRLASEKLLALGCGVVIAKAGKKGAYITKNNEFVHVKGYDVKAIDTTAAGDSFNAGLAYAIAIGNNLAESVKFANAVAGLSTTAIGAQNAMPSLNEVNRFIAFNEKL